MGLRARQFFLNRRARTPIVHFICRSAAHNLFIDRCFLLDVNDRFGWRACELDRLDAVNIRSITETVQIFVRFNPDYELLDLIGV